MAKSLMLRKQELVRDSIFQAAMTLFSDKGFENTTIEDVTHAAGISRRSFFRYYDGKSDLLVAHDLDHGKALAEAIGNSTRTSVREIIQDAVQAAVRYAESIPHMRQIIEISEQNVATRQAHHSRLVEVEDMLVDAFAKRLSLDSRSSVEPRLLAGITSSLINVTVFSWFRGNDRDLQASSERVLGIMGHLFSGDLIELPKPIAKPARLAGTKPRSAGPRPERKGTARRKLQS